MCLSNQLSVDLKTGEIFRFATPEETPALMNDLIEWFRKKIKAKDVNPILLAAEFHYKYIRIHPFDDGNGRTARILMNFIFMQYGYPPTIIKTGDKENYFAVLKQADAGVIEPFFEYIANNLVHSLEIMIEGAKGESIEEADDIDKEIALLDKQFTTVGKAIKIVKTQEILHELFNNSILDLILKYVAKCNLFEKFYLESESIIFFNGSGTSYNPENLIDLLDNETKKELSFVEFSYRYKKLKQIGYEKYNYRSEINFEFEHTRYIVKNSQNLIIEKLYNEQLDEKEINKLINTEMRTHKKFIEGKIEEIKKKK